MAKFREGQRVRVLDIYEKGKVGVITSVSSLRGGGKEFYSVRLPGNATDMLFPDDEIVAVNSKSAKEGNKMGRSWDKVVCNALEYVEAKNAVPVDDSFTPMAYIKGVIRTVKSNPGQKDIEGKAWKVIREKPNYKALASSPEYRELDKLVGVNSTACNADVEGEEAVPNAFDANTPGAKKFIDVACKMIPGGPSNMNKHVAEYIQSVYNISDKDVDAALRFFQFDGMKGLK